MDAGFEVAVTRKDGGRDEVAALDGAFDVGVERAGVADAGRAAVADKIEAELVEVVGELDLVEVVGDDAGAGGQRALHVRVHRQALLDGLLGDEAGGHHHGRVRGVGAGGDRGDHD